MNELLAVWFRRRILVTLFLGFASGLPLLAIGSTLQAWMTELNVDLTLIGIFSLVGMPYTLKFLWAPLFDRVSLPFLGRRRGWMVVTQLATAIALVLLSLPNPSTQPVLTALAAFFVAFCSASQDIVLDAHRRDTLPDEELGLGASLFINGYRIGMLLSGAGALFLSETLAWPLIYKLLAAGMAIGLVTSFFAPEPDVPEGSPQTLKETIVDPFVDYFSRNGAIVILIFILLYKIGDSMASTMTTPFILRIGYSPSELAGIAKTFGLAATILGGLLGGVMMVRLGINKSLWIFGLLQSVSTAGFAVLPAMRSWTSIELAQQFFPWLSGDQLALGCVVGFENLSGGMGTAAYAAYMASLCNKKFSATQYALLSSLMGVPRVLAGAPTGWLAKHTGWEVFFLACALAALPGMLLLIKIAPWNE